MPDKCEIRRSFSSLIMTVLNDFDTQSMTCLLCYISDLGINSKHQETLDFDTQLSLLYLLSINDLALSSVRPVTPYYTTLTYVTKIWGPALGKSPKMT